MLMWLKQLERFNILPFNKVVLFLSAILWILRSQGQKIPTSFQNQNLYTCVFLSVLSLDKQGNILLVSNFYRSNGASAGVHPFPILLGICRRTGTQPPIARSKVNRGNPQAKQPFLLLL